MMNSEQKRPVTLEDLLRLKRAERPAVEFWNKFDRELRAKQLAAIVEKRPWWRSMPRVFGGLARYHLPLGATAILALTVVTVREYRPEVLQPLSTAAASTRDLASQASESHRAVAGSAISAPTASAVLDDAPSASDSRAMVAEVSSTGHLSQIITPLDSTLHGLTPVQESAPSAKFIASNLALARATEPGAAKDFLGATRGFEARAMPARTPTLDPLAQMASPSDVRRSRLLNGAAMSVSLNSPPPSRTTETRARRLSDEQLYDTISRFGARGNSLLVKF